MHHFLYPEKDTFISNENGLSGKNFGVDEQLKISTDHQNVRVSDSSGSRHQSKRFSSRSLLKFNLDSISHSISNGSISNPEFVLRLKVSKEVELPISYKIYAFPVSQSWNKGDGYYHDGGSNSGVSWYYRDYNLGTPWSNYTASYLSSDVDYLTDPSKATESFNRGGGTWYYTDGFGNDLTCTQSFDYESSDINLNVTPIVNSWLSQKIPNEGIILMTYDEIHVTGSDYSLMFFSRDTNTIYSPYLDVLWDDQMWITGSVFTSSVSSSTVIPHFSGTIKSPSYLSKTSVRGKFSGISSLTPIGGDLVSGIFQGVGESETVFGSKILGDITAAISSSFTGSLTSSFLLGTFNSGPFSGSNFTASYDGVLVSNGFLTGSWNEAHLSGSLMSGSIDENFPYATVSIKGPFVSGTALGSFSLLNLTSGSFVGTIADGNWAKTVVNFNYTGSLITSSYDIQTTELTSSVLQPVDSFAPFVSVIQNLKSSYRSGDLIRINVFCREEFPFKDFNRKSQLGQHLIPKILPSSSFYCLKDNLTDEVVLNFDNYTKLSCDERGNYFILDTTGLPQERYFRVIIKTEIDNSVYTFDNRNVFKITR